MYHAPMLVPATMSAAFERSATAARWLICALAMLFSLPVLASEIRGQVRLAMPDGEPVERSEFSDIVVYFEPDSPVPVSAPPSPVEIITVRRQFEPRVTAVVTGTEIQFPNHDRILHNVFSRSPGNRFDLGLYGQGEGESFVFNNSGLARIYCNVHQQMVAYVLVLDTPYMTRPGASGRFRLDNLPPGPGRLSVWQPRADAYTEAMVIETGQMLRRDVDLLLTGRRIPEHADKDGRPYRRRARRTRY